MAGPTNADAVNRYLASIRYPGARRARPPVPTEAPDVVGLVDEDDDVLGAPGTVVEPIEIVGDPNAPIPDDEVEMLGATPDTRVESQGVRNIAASLPSFLSEPFSRVTSDPDSMIGGALRRVIDHEIIPRPPESVVSALPDVVASRVRQIPRSIGQAAADENVEAVQTFGERGADALPLGFGEEIYTGLRLHVDPDYNTPRQQEYTDQPGLTAAPLESDRQRYLRERAARSGRSPVASVAGTVAGTLPSAVLIPGPTAPTAAALANTGRAARVLGSLGRTAQSGVINTAVGGVTGVGLSEGDITTPEGRALIAQDAGDGALWGGVGGIAGQALGETVGGIANLARARLNPTQAQAAATRAIAGQTDFAEGSQQGDIVRRFLASEDAVPTPRDVPTPAPAQAVDSPRVGIVDDADDLAQYVDDVDPIEEDEIEMLGRASDLDPEPRITQLDEQVRADTPRAPYVPPRIADEVIASAPRPRRPGPQHPQQGPSLRAAADRGQAIGSGTADDVTVRLVDELSGLSREGETIESLSGGFQNIKNRRIGQALAEEPPPRGWEDRARDMITATRARLDNVTRHAGATDNLHRPVGQARLALEQAESALTTADTFGVSRGTSPAEVWRQLNNANQSIGQAARREAQHHTSAYRDLLQDSYEDMRGFLADPDAWGRGAASIQRSMNDAVAPLIRDGAAIESRLGRIFQSSTDNVTGDTFRMHNDVRPEPIRAMARRSTDLAYEGEREVLRSWIENQAAHSSQLAQLSDNPATAPIAQQMQARAARILHLLDQAEVDGAAHELLTQIQNLPASYVPGLPAVRIGSLVRSLRGIEAGNIPTSTAGPIMRWLGEASDTIERGAAALPSAVNAIERTSAAGVIGDRSTLPSGAQGRIDLGPVEEREPAYMRVLRGEAPAEPTPEPEQPDQPDDVITDEEPEPAYMRILRGR